VLLQKGFVEIRRASVHSLSHHIRSPSGQGSGTERAVLMPF